MTGALRRPLLQLAALGAAALLAGCTSFGVPSFNVPQIEVPLRTVTVTLEKAGSPIEMRQDQELVVKLLGNPSSGSVWSRTDTTSGVLAPIGGQSFERQGRVKNDFEADGYDVWRFKPGGPGQQTLRFEYRKPRSLEPATQEATFTVTVK